MNSAKSKPLSIPIIPATCFATQGRAARHQFATVPRSWRTSCESFYDISLNLLIFCQTMNC